MKGFITITVRLIRAGQRASLQKWSFLGLSVLVFLGSTAVLAKSDLLPTTPPKVPSVAQAMEGKEASSSANTVPQTVPELPVKIEIKAIGSSSVVVNPISTDIKELDKELLNGAVRFPTSAKLGEAGNVVLFGHSSYLPIVNNQAYKTFNDIQKLVAGDTVIVSSSGTAYTYRVRSMTRESTDTAGIPLSVTGQVLTLSTCDSFGAKTDRFVVVADFVESHPAPF